MNSSLDSFYLAQFASRFRTSSKTPSTRSLAALHPAPLCAGTAERIEAEGDVATAFTLARILSNIPLSRGGPTSVVIFDIHALQERFYFGDTVLPLFESGIPLLRERLRQLPDADNITIAYPDEGAWKRFHYQFGDLPEVICTKVGNEECRAGRC